MDVKICGDQLTVCCDPPLRARAATSQPDTSPTDKLDYFYTRIMLGTK